MSQDLQNEPINEVEVVDESAPVDTTTNARRSLLTKGVLAAAVGAVAGTTLSRNASAANGDTVNVGVSRTGTLTTQLSGGTTFRVNDGDSSGSASIYGTQDGSAGSHGVRGDHAGTAGNGVYGRATNSQGRGVYGESTGSGGRGVYGKTTASDGIGVYGQHLGDTQSGTGVYGLSDRGTGVRGKSTLGTGVVAEGTSTDLLLDGVGRMTVKAGAAIAPNSSGGPGILGRDADDGLWWSPSAGVWRKLAGDGTAGALHPVTPYRVFDSRFNSIFTTPSNRLVSVKDAINVATGAVVTPGATPAGATAVAANITITGTTGAGGFVAINPGGNTTVTASAINWGGPGQTLANAGIFSLDNALGLQVIADGSGSTHVIIDITGYYL